MIAIVVSRGDVASVNIGEALQSQGAWQEHDNVLRSSELLLYYIPDMHLEHDHVNRELPDSEDIEAVVFASRHRSRSGQKTLSVHPIGNYRDSDFGGRNRALVPAAPELMHRALQKLHDNAAALDYDVCYEVTHHGPFLSLPTFFIEVGSSEQEWQDMAACNAIADALLTGQGNASRVAIGLGGGHYAPRFTDLALDEDVAFGHMIPDYQLRHIDESMVQAAVDATSGVTAAYLHGEKGERFRSLLKSNGLTVFSV